MRYSIFSWFGYFQPFQERLDIIKEAGFDEVMLSWEDEFEPVRIPKESMPDRVRKLGLEISNFHAPFMGYNEIWEKNARESKPLLDRLCGFVADCRRFNVPALVVHTNDLDLGPFKMENGLRFFSILAEAGEKYGVDIAVENVSRQYLLTWLLDHIQTEHFGMCYDSSHDYMLHCGRGHLLNTFGERMKAMHLSDNDGHLDRHWIPGEGNIPFHQIVPKIQDVGMDTLSFEVNADWYWRSQSPLAFCRRVRHSLDPIVKEKSGKPGNIVSVAAAIIQDGDGHILICRRGPGGSCGNLWEFPGGKMEPGETVKECLVRECQEELDIKICCGEVYDHASYTYPDQRVSLTFITAKIISGTPSMKVHQDMRWVRPEEMLDYPFCPGDEAVIRHMIS